MSSAPTEEGTVHLTDEEIAAAAREVFSDTVAADWIENVGRPFAAAILSRSPVVGAVGGEPTPLTVEHIERLWGEFMSAQGSGYVPDFVRAIEAAHGIGVSPTGSPEGEVSHE